MTKYGTVSSLYIESDEAVYSNFKELQKNTIIYQTLLQIIIIFISYLNHMYVTVCLALWKVTYTHLTFHTVDKHRLYVLSSIVTHICAGKEVSHNYESYKYYFLISKISGSRECFRWFQTVMTSCVVGVTVLVHTFCSPLVTILWLKG